MRVTLGSGHPAHIFNWWRQLSPQQHAWLKAHQRDAIAGLDGIPVNVRDELHRERITARLWQLDAERAQLMCSVAPGDRARLEKLQTLIASHEAMLAPDLTVLLSTTRPATGRPRWRSAM